MFKFIQEGKEYFVKYLNEEKRPLTNLEINNLYERINSVIDILGLKEDYDKAKLDNLSLIDFAYYKDIDLDACLYATLSQFRLERPLV